MGDMELRRYKYKGTALAKASSSWQYWDEVPGHMKVAGGRHYRNISDPMYAGRGKKHLKLGKWVKGRAPIYRTEEVAAQKLATSSKYLIAAAVTAGALLLWNATRSKQRTPLDQRDIPASTHGEPSNMPVGADNLPSYQPTARITPNRAPAYNTNIDMNTEDYNDVVDYKNIANTMSSMSRAALGIESANVNLNVMDDSRKMNPYTIQRELSEYLNKG